MPESPLADPVPPNSLPSPEHPPVTPATGGRAVRRPRRSGPGGPSHLIQRIREGDEAAFADLYREHYELLLLLASRYLNRFGGAREWTCEASDIVEEVFVGLWERRQALDVRGPAEGYLRAAVHRNVLYQFRREKPGVSCDLESAGAALPAVASLDEELMAGERVHATAAAVKRLPRKCRRIFLLYRYDELSYQDIARHLGISVRTVEAHIRHARDLLRVWLPEEYWLEAWREHAHRCSQKRPGVKSWRQP